MTARCLRRVADELYHPAFAEGRRTQEPLSLLVDDDRLAPACGAGQRIPVFRDVASRPHLGEGHGVAGAERRDQARAADGVVVEEEEKAPRIVAHHQGAQVALGASARRLAVAPTARLGRVLGDQIFSGHEVRDDPVQAPEVLAVVEVPPPALRHSRETAGHAGPDRAEGVAAHLSGRVARPVSAALGDHDRLGLVGEERRIVADGEDLVPGESGQAGIGVGLDELQQRLVEEGEVVGQDADVVGDQPVIGIQRLHVLQVVERLVAHAAPQAAVGDVVHLADEVP